MRKKNECLLYYLQLIIQYTVKERVKKCVIHLSHQEYFEKIS